MIKISDKKEQVKLISAMVMGDGGGYIQKKSSHASFTMNMTSDHRDYGNYCAAILQNITSTRMVDRGLSDDGWNRKPQFTLSTRVHPFFTKLRDRIYVGTYKSLDFHALKMLDYEMLSFLYMSDGSFWRRSADNIPRGKTDELRVTLNMKRLSYGDQEWLRQVIKKNTGLIWNINRNGKYCYLRLISACVAEFMENITPYILPSFAHKITDDNRTVGSKLRISLDDDIVRAA